MNLNNYEEDDFYAFKYSLKVRKNQSPENIASILKIWLVLISLSTLYNVYAWRIGYGELISWIITGWAVLLIPIILIFSIKKIYQKHQMFQSILFVQGMFLLSMSWMNVFKNVMISGSENTPISETNFMAYYVYYNIFIYICIIVTFFGGYLYTKSSLENGILKKNSVDAKIKKLQLGYITPGILLFVLGGIILSVSKIDFIWGNYFIFSVLGMSVSLLGIFMIPKLSLIIYCKKRFLDFIIDYSKEETEI